MYTSEVRNNFVGETECHQIMTTGTFTICVIRLVKLALSEIRTFCLQDAEMCQGKAAHSVSIGNGRVATSTLQDEVTNTLTSGSQCLEIGDPQNHFHTDYCKEG